MTSNPLPDVAQMAVDMVVRLGRECDRLERERDKAQAEAEQLPIAKEALRKIRDKARLDEKNPGGAMAASWVEHVADNALIDLGEVGHELLQDHHRDL